MRQLILAAAVLAAPATAQAGPQAAIEAAMAASAAGWNTGSLDRFMAVYADDATYVAGTSEVARGKPAIAARYAKSFTDGGNTRGRLSFQPVAWRTLSPVHVLLVARWTLTPTTGTAQSGLTSLLFERRREGWRIIADHSS
jgi:uncharacterized protein (TIGR02246 family)